MTKQMNLIESNKPECWLCKEAAFFKYSAQLDRVITTLAEIDEKISDIEKTEDAYK